MLSIQSSRPSPKIKNTRTDNKFRCAKSLFVTSARIGNSVDILNDFDKLARSASASRTKLQYEWKNVSRLIVPLLSHATHEISTSARVLAPLPDIQILQTRGDSALKRKLAFDNKYDHHTTTSAKLICHHIHTQQDINKENEIVPYTTSLPPPSKRSCRSASNNQYDSEKHPLLCNRNQALTKIEVVRLVVSNTKYKTTERSSPINAIINHQHQFGVSTSYRGITGLVQKFEKTSKLPIGEFGMGRPPFAFSKDIVSVAKICNGELGKTLSRSDVGDEISKIHNQRLIESGIQPLMKTKMSDRSLGRYFVQVADQCDISIAATAIPKTSTRDAAERSIRAAVATLVLLVQHICYQLTNRMTIYKKKTFAVR